MASRCLLAGHEDHAITAVRLEGDLDAGGTGPDFLFEVVSDADSFVERLVTSLEVGSADFGPLDDFSGDFSEDSVDTDLVIPCEGSASRFARVGILCFGIVGHPARPWHRSQILQSQAELSPKYSRMVRWRHALLRA